MDNQEAQNRIKEKLKNKLDFIFLGSFEVETTKETFGDRVNIYIRDAKVGDSFKATFYTHIIRTYPDDVVNKFCDAILSERSQRFERHYRGNDG